jgi:hypothetical protein
VHDEVRVAARLVAWTNVWLTGSVNLDEVVRVLTEATPTTSLDALGLARPVPDWLVMLQDHGTRRLALLLPAPGDVRGMPVGCAFADEVLQEGLGVQAVGADLGISVEHRRVGNDIEGWTSTWVWSLASCPGAPGPLPEVAEAAQILAGAVHDATRELARLELVPRTSRPQDPVGIPLRLPPDVPRRVAALLERAERMAEALELALSAPSGARTGFEEHSRSEALRRVADAVRLARLVGWNSVVPELL